MCGRVCSLSCVKGGVEYCGVCHACPVVRGRRGLLVACVGVGGLAFPACGPTACGCVLVAARRGVAIFVGEGRLAWVFLSCFCSRVRVRARACLFVLCGV